MAAKIEILEPAGASSDHKLDEELLSTLKEFQRTSLQPKPVEDAHSSFDALNKLSRNLLEEVQRGHQSEPVQDLHQVLLGISHHLDNETSAQKTIYDRLLAIENQTRGRHARASRGFARYLVAICIGVAATLAWLSYGEAAKQIIAAKAPELGWSPEAKQMIASWVRRWSNVAESRAVPSSASLAQTAPAAVAPLAPATPSINPEQVHQIASDLAALRQTVDRVAASQDQMAHEITGLQTSVTGLQASSQEVLEKIPASPPPIAAPAHQPKPIAPRPSRAPMSLYAPPHP